MIECIPGKCDNILTVEGVRLLEGIDNLIVDDPDWERYCLADSPTNRTCVENPSPGGFMAKASPLALFSLAEAMLGRKVTEKQEDIDQVFA